MELPVAITSPLKGFSKAGTQVLQRLPYPLLIKEDGGADKGSFQGVSIPHPAPFMSEPSSCHALHREANSRHGLYLWSNTSKGLAHPMM